MFKIFTMWAVRFPPLSTMARSVQKIAALVVNKLKAINSPRIYDVLRIIFNSTLKQGIKLLLISLFETEKESCRCIHICPYLYTSIHVLKQNLHKLILCKQIFCDKIKNLDIADKCLYSNNCLFISDYKVILLFSNRYANNIS